MALLSRYELIINYYYYAQDVIERENNKFFFFERFRYQKYYHVNSLVFFVLNTLK